MRKENDKQISLLQAHPKVPNVFYNILHLIGSNLTHLSDCAVMKKPQEQCRY